ncbi:zinc finger protein 354A-like [Pantherophis guttatus]|uniref:Zinc finger protein 354A-like n=1 Tax=Pantherophis guttatus TaxID=94885 RepID=A0ABM3YVG5_PANGU|nr:zinc finger protein 354A-like [Pantherophis guttatus]
MATPQVLTSSPNETWKVPEGLPASEEPVEKEIKSKVPPKEGDSCPGSSRRSTRIKPSKHKERRTTFRGETGLAKHLKGHARARIFKCVICEKSFSKKSSLLIHQWSPTHSKGLVDLQYRATDHDKSHLRKPRKERTYRCQKCRKVFFLRENFIKHQKIHLPPVPGQAQAGNPSIDRKGKAKKAGSDQSELLLEEMTSMKLSLDLLILNQQAQLQALRGIQSQLNILLPGNNLISSNVYRLGVLLSQQAAAMRSVSFSFFVNPSNPLPQSASNSSS